MHTGAAQFLRVALLAGAFLAGMAAGGGKARADVSPVFRYSFPDSSSDIVSNPNVTDVSPARNDGNVSGTGLAPGTGLSSNVPAGRTGQSVDFTAAGTHAIRTNGTQLLSTPAVASAGGFTYDVWVFPTALPTGTGLFKVIDYAGTESLAITSGGLVRGTLNSATPTLESTNTLTLNEWHHLTMIFDTKGNAAEADPARAGFFQVNGEVSLLVDGIGSGPLARLRNGFGDSLNRPIGIASHPTSTGERFIGLLYNPTVSLGVVPEPASVGLIAIGTLTLLARRRRL
jgi:hypothetical protein